MLSEHKSLYGDPIPGYNVHTFPRPNPFFSPRPPSAAKTQTLAQTYGTLLKKFPTRDPPSRRMGAENFRGERKRAAQRRRAKWNSEGISVRGRFCPEWGGDAAATSMSMRNITPLLAGYLCKRGLTKTLKPFVAETNFKTGIFGVRGLKTLKVVLTEEIDGLGRAGQVVGVAPGYARNKLIPHHLALPALDKYVTLVNNQLKIARPHLLVAKEDVKSTDSISEEEKFEEIEAALRRLDTGKLVLRRDVSGLNNLQRAVTKEDIVFEVKRQMGVELVASNLMLPADLTILGEFDVLLRFPGDLMMPGGQENLHLKVRIRRK